MKQILLDTNFILTCIRNKIDLFDELFFSGLKPIIPKQVIKEIEKITNSNKRMKFKKEAELAIIILKKQSFESPEIKGKTVDNAIINYAKQNPELIVATLDKEIQSKIQNKKMILNRNKLEIL
jgi:hypothetical protein